MKKGWKVCGPLYIKEEWCKGCGICVEFCPRKILTLGEEETVKVVRPEECTACGLCELRCPDFALGVVKNKNQKKER
jgi:2-oxoglutarate ferredoxin oxidoreductase subunit delta